MNYTFYFGQIIRVKNCSGPKQIKWIGAWHTQDTRWANVSDSIRRELDSETFHDGGFWMAYGDFLKYFQVQVLHKLIVVSYCLVHIETNF